MSENADYSSNFGGKFLRLPKKVCDRIKNHTVIIGFSGFGNVGYLSLTHIVETLPDLKSIAFWGNSSWYHQGRLESILTVYEHEPTQTIIILPRLPIPVNSIPQKYWDDFAEEILSWNCKEYIIIGGLKEDTRVNGSVDWAAFVPSPQWQKVHDTPRTLLDHLPMIGPLSSFITQGTKMELPVLGLLGYCSLQEDPSAALVAVAEIEKLRGMQIAIKDNLVRFDYSFIPSTFFPMKMNQNGSLGSFDQHDIEEDDGDDEEFGFSMDELT